MSVTILTICGAVLILSVFTPFVNPFFRIRKLLKRSSVPDDNKTTKEYPPVSIILILEKGASSLSNHISSFLEQDYPNDYQVVLVVEKGDSENEDIIKKYSNDKHIYTTFIPDSSRYMSRKKLAVTLGVKASLHEWVILTEPYSMPNSGQWLRTMAKNFQKGTDIVIGYSNYEAYTKLFYRFERLFTSCQQMCVANKGTAFTTNSSNIAFRKSMFLSKGGYAGNLHLIKGEYDFIVNKYAKRNNTKVVLQQNAWIKDHTPDKKTWYDKHVFYKSTYQELRRRFLYAIKTSFDISLMLFNYMAIISLLIYTFITGNYILMTIPFVSLLISIMLRIVIANKALSFFKENIPAWKLPFMELGIPILSIKTFIRYRKADKTDFTSHKI